MQRYSVDPFARLPVEMTTRCVGILIEFYIQPNACFHTQCLLFLHGEKTERLSLHEEKTELLILKIFLKTLYPKYMIIT